MKKLFTSIRQGKLDEVARILDKNPDLISCLAKAPPKKDDGQSPLMVAIKSDNLEVAHLLLDRGADVNFRDAPTQPYNESAPIWYNAVGQCFMRAGHTVAHDGERSKGYFLLLRRLLEMGMDPNQKFISRGVSRNAWQVALEKYDYFAHVIFYDPAEHPLSHQQELTANSQLRRMLTAVLDLLLAYGVNIQDYEMPDQYIPMSSVLMRNLEEGRDLYEGFYGMDPSKLKPRTTQYRGKERVIQPIPVEEWRRRYDDKWRELEPILRAYYDQRSAQGTQ